MFKTSLAPIYPLNAFPVYIFAFFFLRQNTNYDNTCSKCCEFVLWLSYTNLVHNESLLKRNQLQLGKCSNNNTVSKDSPVTYTFYNFEHISLSFQYGIPPFKLRSKLRVKWSPQDSRKCRYISYADRTVVRASHKCIIVICVYPCRVKYKRLIYIYTCVCE